MLADILVVAVIVIVGILCIRSLVNGKKKGCSECGGSCAGGCAGCSAGCGQASQIQNTQNKN